MALAGLQAGEAVTLFNVCEIPREGIAPLVLEFYDSEIVDLASDLLLIAAPDEAGNRILNRLGVQNGTGLPDGCFTAATRLHRLPAGAVEGFNELWLLELKDPNDPAPVSETELGQRFSTLCASSPSLFRSAPGTLTMCVPGLGQDGISTEEVAAQMLRLARRWAVQSSSLSVVRAVVSDSRLAFDFGTAVDRIHGRDVSDEDRATLLDTCAFLPAVEMEDVPEIAAMLTGIRSLGQAPAPSVRSICIQCRRLAEMCSKRLWALYYPERELPMALVDRLRGLQHEISSRQAWITSYMYLLSTCGSKATEQQAGQMTAYEAAASVLAALRVAQFTSGEISRLSSR